MACNDSGAATVALTSPCILSRSINRDITDVKVCASLSARNNETREGGASFAGLVLPVDVIAALRDDLSGLVERGHRHRCEHGAGGDKGKELGHWECSRNLGWDGADQATICAAWFNVAKAIGTNTAQAAIRA